MYRQISRRRAALDPEAAIQAYLFQFFAVMLVLDSGHGGDVARRL